MENTTFGSSILSKERPRVLDLVEARDELFTYFGGQPLPFDDFREKLTGTD